MFRLLVRDDMQSARISGMILLIIVSAFVLNLLISLSGVADAMTKWITAHASVDLAGE